MKKDVSMQSCSHKIIKQIETKIPLQSEVSFPGHEGKLLWERDLVARYQLSILLHVTYLLIYAMRDVIRLASLTLTRVSPRFMSCASDPRCRLVSSESLRIAINVIWKIHCIGRSNCINLFQCEVAKLGFVGNIIKSVLLQDDGFIGPSRVPILE